MSFWDVLLLGLALSADAFSVTISNMFVYPNETRARQMLMPLFFGLFQGGMPLLGYYLGGVAAVFIENYAGIITLVILGFIGGNMIREGLTAILHPEASESANGEEKRLTLPVILLQAVATAIDAFAVGVSLRAQNAEILSSSVIITLTTFACCCIALVVGRKFGEILGDRAEVVGGCVLVGIGIKAFLGL